MLGLVGCAKSSSAKNRRLRHPDRLLHQRASAGYRPEVSRTRVETFSLDLMLPATDFRLLEELE